MSPTAAQALTGVRVLDLSRWVAGEFAARLFGDFGADVIKVERPGQGSLTRLAGPGDVSDPDATALFLSLNVNKRGIALDLTDDADRAVLLDLVAGSDAVIESFRPGALERLGLGPEVLRGRRPSLVLTRISAFGQTGPYRDREATGIVLQAMGGPMNATGQSDREPLRKPGYLEHYTIGRSAAAATMAGLLHARRTGRGSVIDVSGQEVLLGGADRRASYLLSAAYSGMTAPRGARSPHRFGATFSGPMATRDGHVMIYVTNQAFWDRMARMIGAQYPEFAEEFVGQRVIMGADRDRFLSTCAEWFGERDKIAVMEEAERNRIPITAILSVREVFEHPHFRERGAFATIDHPRAGRLEYTGAPFRMERGYALHRPAPLLDEHRAEILADAHQMGAVG